MKETVILSNSGYCTSCNSYIYSGHRHDYVSCECGSVSVDGGGEYLRRVGGCLEGGFKDTSIVVSKEDYDNTLEICTEEALLETLDSDSHREIFIIDILIALGFLQKEHDSIESKILGKCMYNLTWALGTGRNNYGIICAVARGYMGLPNKRWFE